MKRKNEDETTQTSIRLSQDLYGRLKRASGERGMGEEIRRRLEGSFATERASANPKTQELLDAIAFVGDQTDLYYDDWSKNAFAFEVLRACVNTLLMASRPIGEAVPPPNTAASLLFGDDESPEEIARSIVTDLMRDRKKREIADEGKRR